MKVNCAAIPTELIESELFGHEKGAYTGAATARRGKFELADGGTLFLDEVGDLHAGSQAKLLRVLQEGEFHRVGGEQPVRVNVRVIAATNRDLGDMIAQGQVSGRSVLQALRCACSSPVFTRAPPGYSGAGLLLSGGVLRTEQLPKAVYRSGGYARTAELPWPGNARELRNVVERMAILSSGDQIGLDAVPTEIRNYRENMPKSSVQEARESAERDHIQKALDAANWNVSSAARALGMERTNLHKRMRALGVSREQILTNDAFHWTAGSGVKLLRHATTQVCEASGNHSVLHGFRHLLRILGRRDSGVHQHAIIAQFHCDGSVRSCPDSRVDDQRHFGDTLAQDSKVRKF